MTKCFAGLAILLLCWQCSCAQRADSLRNRKIALAAGAGAVYAGAITGLATIWYADFPKSSFHFFNDGDEWLGMDKVGHGFSSYSEGLYSYQLMRWAGYTEKQSAIIGGSAGTLFQLPIEIMDGFSAEYGASVWDLGLNSLGSALFVAQQLGWGEQRVLMKFSWSPTDYPPYRPNVLGHSPLEQLIKDYNAQTYWLSGNLKSISEAEFLPLWLNVSLGYGVDGLTGAHRNIEGTEFFNRTSQWYLSPDIDLSKIQTNSKVVRTVLKSLNCLKVPAPAAEYSSAHGFRWHWLYF